MSDILDDDISFDKYKLENELEKNKEKIYKIKENVIFSLLPNKTKNKKDKKYFVDIKNKKQHYIGILTTHFKKELFGYILLYQGDEYLGQFLNENKNGFGVYKYKPDKNGQDIYIGNFSNNIMSGEGIYINIQQSEIKDDILILTKYNCHIGLFENGRFIKGKIYAFDNDNEKLEFQDEEEKDKEIILNNREKEVINYEKKNNIYIYNKGIMQDKRLTHGIVISFNENDEIENKFSYKLKDCLQYKYEYLNDEKKEKEMIKVFKKKNYIEYKRNIQELLNKIDQIINHMKNDFNYARSLDISQFNNFFSDNYNLLIK